MYALRNKKTDILFLCIVLGLNSILSQKMTRKMYIEEYKDIAIKEMNRCGIPASITLAQGILESNSGNSMLAVKGNNHFGIKCHDNWNGKKMYHDDDEKRECFRKYKSAYESYVDHSDFLVNTPRYASLFSLKSTDYKAWAKGLKKAGYATSPRYDNALIRIIEEERLYMYDKGISKSMKRRDRKKYQKHLTDEEEFTFSLSGRKIHNRNRIEYIIVKQGDTFYTLAQDLEMMPWELYKYNDLNKDDPLTEGQMLYLQPKRNKAAFGTNFHTVAEGETLYDISQKYGVKMKALRKKNALEEGEALEAGTKLWLRKKKKKKDPDREDEQKEKIEMDFEQEEEESIE